MSLYLKARKALTLVNTSCGRVSPILEGVSATWERPYGVASLTGRYRPQSQPS